MDYKYKDQHFSVEIAQALLADARASGSKMRHIRAYLLSKHQERGGLEPPEGQSGNPIVQKRIRKTAKDSKNQCYGQ